MLLKNETNHSLNWIDGIIIAIAIAYCMSPYISSILNFFVCDIIFLSYILYTSIIYHRGISYISIKYIFLIIFIAFINTVIKEQRVINDNFLISEFMHFTSKFHQLLICFFSFYLFNIINIIASKKEKFIIIFLFSVTILYTTYKTLSAFSLYKNNFITRDFSRFNDLSEIGAGGYYFIYSLPLIIIATTLVILNTRNKNHKKILYILTGITALLLLKAGYSLAIIGTIFGLMLYYFSYNRDSRKKTIVVLVLFILSLFSPFIFHFLAMQFQETAYFEKLQEMSSFFSTGETGSNMNGRLTLYAASIDAFFSSPLYGHSKLPYDGHSTFLDIFADLGIIGGIPFCSLFIFLKKDILTHLNKGRKIYEILFIVFIFLGIVNPIHASSSIMFTIFFIAPLFLSYYLESTSNKI